MKSTAAIACLLTSSYGLQIEGEITIGDNHTSTCFSWNGISWAGESCGDSPAWTTCGCNTCTPCGSYETICYDFTYGPGTERPCEASDNTIVDNHTEYFYKQKYVNEERCTGGCPDQMDGYGSGKCHESHPINDELKFDSPNYDLRCQYPLEPVEDDTGDELYEFNQKHLDKHNEYRRLHQETPDLEYDAELAVAALEWSKYLSTIGFLQHSQEPGYGENLAWSSNQAQAESTWATEAWYEEIEDYNFNSPGYQGGTGHFTQAIWVNSEKIGCAEYDNYVTCRYFPQGNIANAGYFEANVKPLKE